MATWKKVIVSGSDALLNSLLVSNGPFQVTGSSILSGSLEATGSIGLSGSVLISGPVNLEGTLIITGSASGSFSGSFAGDGSQLTGVTAAAANALTQGTGITDFSYNGGSAGITVAVSGAVDLVTNVVTKWSGAAFVTSSITDSTNVTINNAGGVLIEQGGLYVTGSSTFHDNVVVQGNLTVAGTASFQNTQNLEVADQFILLNSGSATFQDSGIVINTGNSGNSGSAFFLETASTTIGSPQNGRFAIAGSVLPDATTVTAEEYMNSTVIAAAAASGVPQFGGTLRGQGNMWVDTTNGDIFIYA